MNKMNLNCLMVYCCLFPPTYIIDDGVILAFVSSMIVVYSIAVYLERKPVYRYEEKWLGKWYETTEERYEALKDDGVVRKVRIVK